MSLVFVVALEALHLPAALLLGPMAAGVLIALAEARVRVPPLPYALAQGVVGCMIARSIPLSVLGEVMAEWPIFIGGVLSVLLASYGFGWVLGRLRVLPGSTAIWGSSPGGATAMTVLAEVYGADVRLVAFMQYVRVALVALAASLVAGIFGGRAGALPDIQWFPHVAAGPLAGTLALAFGGVALARAVKLPGGALIVPLVGGVLLHGILTITLPPWLTAIAYALIGWSIGLRFTRGILSYALRTLPQVVTSILCLMVFCGGFAALLVVLAGVDPLTAYLATSPGGADTVAIVAASSNVDMPFIMAMQTVRLILVLTLGPALARLLAGRFAPTVGAPPHRTGR